MNTEDLEQFQQPQRTRLDVWLSENKMAASRSKARELIESGMVSVNGAAVMKPSFPVKDSDIVKLTAEGCPYVSRGGWKLEKALKCFCLDPTGKTCLDIGASTGGFTDCLLQHGAEKVYAVDVGSHQLAERLRTDPRVVNLENCHIGQLTVRKVPQPCELLTCDVSFISLTKVFGPARAFLTVPADCVFLVKPQFEAGRRVVRKGKGIIRDPKVYEQVLETVYESAESFGYCSVRPSVTSEGLEVSPIRGGDGNTEFLVYLQYTGKNSDAIPEEMIRRIVRSIKE